MLDRRPRKLAAEHYSLLSNFSEMAVRRLEETAHPDLKVQHIIMIKLLISLLYYDSGKNQMS